MRLEITNIVINILFRTSENLSDPIVLQKYNTSVNQLFKFVPVIFEEPPFEFIICLVWTFPEAYKLSSDVSYHVSLNHIN